MGRGPQKKGTLVHINLYITRRAHEYFSANANVSKAIRDALDEYASAKINTTPNNVRGLGTDQTNQEETDNG